ncbi:MAG: hypothetical protein P8J33_08075 [Pirellulaceae bacterium]|nr:hypothetical protein [Pirellulaceae bacterium]
MRLLSYDCIRLMLTLIFLSLFAGFGYAQEDTKTGSKESKQIDVKDDQPEINRFMRIRRNAKKEPIGMETSVTRYVTKNADGKKVTVDLIGVVHIGEEKYYEDLNELFTQYDALLYELVAPEGTVVPKGGGERGFNAISGIQQGMQSVLGLEFQLEHIDYTAPNFVHADMTPEEFSASMEENEESIFKMALKAMGQGMARQSKAQASGTPSAETGLLLAMFENDKGKIREVMAEQMLDLESGMIIFQGKDGSTIIDHRNTKAFDILREQIESGKTRIGVFYGAGHLPDMDERLLKGFGMKRGGQVWLEAWDLNEK